jgi:hypothetical protein
MCNVIDFVENSTEFALGLVFQFLQQQWVPLYNVQIKSMRIDVIFIILRPKSSAEYHPFK